MVTRNESPYPFNPSSARMPPSLGTVSPKKSTMRLSLPLSLSMCVSLISLSTMQNSPTFNVASCPQLCGRTNCIRIAHGQRVYQRMDMHVNKMQNRRIARFGPSLETSNQSASPLGPENPGPPLRAEPQLPLPCSVGILERSIFLGLQVLYCARVQ
jgi:hypothetical protein